MTFRSKQNSHVTSNKNIPGMLGPKRIAEMFQNIPTKIEHSYNIQVIFVPTGMLVTRKKMFTGTLRLLALPNFASHQTQSLARLVRVHL